MSVSGGYATMSRFGGGLTLAPGMSTLDPHELTRLTHRAMAIETSHLPADCGPMSAFGSQTESTKKNQPSFFFGRTTRAERARACNFDERSMKEALQVIEANYGRTERLVPPPGAYDSEAAWDATGAVGDSWSRNGRLATGLLARDSVRDGLTRSTRFPKKHAHDFGKAVGREDVSGGATQTFSGDLAAQRERRFGVDVERFATADVSSFGKQVARRSSTFPHADFATTLSRRKRDASDARRRHGGAMEALARGQDAPPATKTAVVLSSVGAQTLSTRATGRALSWGRSPRSPAPASSAARELEARRGPGMYHRVEDFRDTLREMRETRRIARTARFGTYESAYEKRRTLSSTLPSVSPRGFATERALDPRLTSSAGMFGVSPGTSRASPTSTLKYWARGAPAGTGTGMGTRGRREPRFFPQTNAELRDAYARERDMGGRHPDGSKRRLWA